MHLPTPEQRNFFEQAAMQYQSDLATDTTAQGYLRSRGITPQVAATYRLGVLRNPLVGHERYRGRLSIPYLTPSGVVTFTFRCIQPHWDRVKGAGAQLPCSELNHGKYLAPEGFDRTLYNVLALRVPSPRIFLVEGEVDAMTWTFNGWPTLGIPGVENFKDHHARCLTDYSEVIAITDGDDAGYRLGSFLAREVRARVIRLPRKEDGNSLYVKGGRDALAAVLTGI